MAEKEMITSRLLFVGIALCTFSAVLSAKYSNYKSQHQNKYSGIFMPNVACTGLQKWDTVNNDLTVICEGMIYLNLQRRLNYHHNLQLRCISNDLIDFYGYTSLFDLLGDDVMWREEFGKAIGNKELIIYNCSMPTRGFASIFSPDIANSSILSFNNYVHLSSLEIDCGNVQHYHITRNHLRGLVLLRFSIECPSLTNLPEDTFRDVASRLEKVTIRFTAIREIQNTLFKNMTELSYLDLRGNKIKLIHEDAFVGSKIDRIHLQNNHIQVLDGLFSHSDHLDFINIESNSIIHLPFDMSGYNKVIFFFASNNQIKCLTEKNFEGMTSLIFLRLSHNNISYIHSNAFSRTIWLSELYLNGNSLGRYSSGYSECFNSTHTRVGPESDEGKQSLMTLDEGIFSNNKELYAIDLSDNSIATLPETLFSNNEKLKELKLQSNNISVLPDTLLKNNFKLTELNLANNNIVEIPIGFLNSQSVITHLYLNGNNLTSIDKDLLCNSSKLEEFYVHSNRIESLPIELFDRCNGSLRIMDFSYNQLTSFPKFYLPELTDLNLANNILTKIEDETFHEMSKLQSLNLSCNFIHTIVSHPIYLGSQPLLTLDISNNNLSGINYKWFPNRWTDIKLKLLYFSRNNNLLYVPHFLFEIEELDISRMSEETTWAIISKQMLMHTRRTPYKIKILNLSHNHLRGLKNKMDWYLSIRMFGAECIFRKMGKLEVLNLSHNEIDVIPLELRIRLPNLRHLDLSHNRIKYLYRDDFLIYKGFTYSFNLPNEDKYLKTFSMYPYLEEFRRNWANDKGEIFHSLVVDLRHNNIEGVQLGTEYMALVPKVHWRDVLFSHATYLLGHNPINCGCDLFQLISYSLEEMRPVGELERTTGERKYLPAKVNIDDLSCYMPESVRGKKASEPESWMYHLLPLYGMCKLMSV